MSCFLVPNPSVGSRTVSSCPLKIKPEFWIHHWIHVSETMSCLLQIRSGQRSKYSYHNLMYTHQFSYNDLVCNKQLSKSTIPLMFCGVCLFGSKNVHLFLQSDYSCDNWCNISILSIFIMTTFCLHIILTRFSISPKRQVSWYQHTSL